MDINEDVQALLDSGVEPITMKRESVRSCESGDAVAFRTSLYINSLDIGTLSDDEYQVTAERTKRAVSLFYRALTYACRAIDECNAAGLEYDWISVRCPVSAITKAEVFETVRRATKNEDSRLSKLCFEFPTKILFDTSDKIDDVIRGIGTLGIRTMLYGYGEEFCPTARLTAYHFDYVALDGSVVEMMRNESLRMSAESLVSFARGLNIGIIAPGVDREQVERLKALGCFGYSIGAPGRLFDEVGKWQAIEQ